MVSQAPEAVDVVRARHGETLRYFGLPFARVRRVMDSGRVWFGESAQDIARKMREEGVEAPFYCVRVGQDFYVRKGGHRVLLERVP